MSGQYINQIQVGVEFVEQKLDEPISLADVASAAGLSQWHFQRIFKSITGETLKSYIRARRMSHSLDALLSTDQRILDIAIAAGYVSQESFSGAFRQAFGITPGEFRKIGSQHRFLKKAEIDEHYLRHIASQVSSEPETWRPGPLSLVGLETEFHDSGSEKNNLAEKLPAIWDSFLPRIEDVPGLVEDAGYGVVGQTDHRSDVLSYLAGVESRSDAPLPEDMRRRETPDVEYARFAHRGDPRQLDETVNYVYGNWLPRSGRRHSGDADLEIYGPQYIPASQDSVIYYAVPLV